MKEIVYLNGRLVPRGRALISAFDHGFLYGYGLFETMRAYNGVIFRLDSHLARLRRSAGVLGFTAKLAGIDLESACQQTLLANNLKEASIRLMVTAGPGEPIPDPATTSQPTVLVMARRYRPIPAQVYQQGYRAIISELRRDSLSPLSQVKASNYLISYMARQEARAAGADEALLLNERNLLSEGSTTNIFLVLGKFVLTPHLHCGLLPGITREAVLELAGSLGLEAAEWELGERDLFQAQEAFLTNSLIQVMPLTQVSGQPVGSGQPGLITRKLMAAYRKLVARETSG